MAIEEQSRKVILKLVEESKIALQALGFTSEEAESMSYKLEVFSEFAPKQEQEELPTVYLYYYNVFADKAVRIACRYKLGKSYHKVLKTNELECFKVRRQKGSQEFYLFLPHISRSGIYATMLEDRKELSKFDE